MPGIPGMEAALTKPIPWLPCPVGQLADHNYWRQLP
jgi:hypothetical protein